MKMENGIPLISIIMTTYNGSAFINETIESIISQCVTDWELIILDDGSTDSTCSIVRSVNDKRIKLIETGRVGVNGKLKNIGLAQARGSFIAFIDHDDLWSENKLRRQIELLNKFPNAGFCICSGYNFEIKGQPLEHFRMNKGNAWSGRIFEYLLNGEVSGWTQVVLMRRKCVDDIGLFDEQYNFADPEFLYRLAYHFDAVICNEAMFFHRVHASNYTKVKRDDSHAEGIKTIQSLRSKKLINQKQASFILFRSYIHFGEKCIGLERRSAAIKSFMVAWKHRPLSIVPLKKTVKAVMRYWV